MNKKIVTYNDLIEEKARLELVLASKKSDIKQDWQGIKHSLKPATNIFGLVSRFSKRKRMGPVMDMGVDLIGDVLFRKLILRRAGWITRMVLPIFIKNVSSNALGHVAGGGIFSKLKNLIKNRKSRKSGLHTEPENSANFQSDAVAAGQDPSIHVQPNAGTFGTGAGDVSSR